MGGLAGFRGVTSFEPMAHHILMVEVVWWYMVLTLGLMPTARLLPLTAEAE
jgi:hypothetical protein